MIVKTVTEHPAVDALRAELGAIELDVTTSYTLADAMREGSTVTSQKTGGWIDSSSACALGASYLAARARGYITD
jgi:hypothetical protein